MAFIIKFFVMQCYEKYKISRYSQLVSFVRNSCGRFFAQCKAPNPNFPNVK